MPRFPPRRPQRSWPEEEQDSIEVILQARKLYSGTRSAEAAEDAVEGTRFASSLVPVTGPANRVRMQLANTQTSSHYDRRPDIVILAQPFGEA